MVRADKAYAGMYWSDGEDWTLSVGSFSNKLSGDLPPIILAHIEHYDKYHPSDLKTMKCRLS